MQVLRLIILLLLVRLILFDITVQPDGMDWMLWLALAVDTLFLAVISVDLVAGRPRQDTDNR